MNKPIKVVVDTNIVFSALLNSNSKIGNLLLDSRGNFEFYSCKYLQKEIFRHLPKIQKYSKLANDNMFELLNLLESKILFIDEDLLPNETIRIAKELVTNVDNDDIAFVALANHIDALLWTGDKKLIMGLKAQNYKSIITTLELTRLIEIKKR